MTVAWGLLFVLFAGLYAWRRAERRALRRSWQSLVGAGAASGAAFDPASVGGLPAPAQRLFRFAIEPGAPLHTVVEVDMHGELGLGTKNAPNYRPMRARQVLAPPAGFIWAVDTGSGLARITGSDGMTATTSWSHFALFGLLPVVRAGGTEDHRRAAFGRLVGEAVFWAPAALLPGTGVHWVAVDADTARVTVEFAGLTQSADVTVASDGRPVSVVLPRWSDANPEKTFRLQPFGGTLAGFETFDGYRLPTQIEAGNFFG
ncbi:MAG: DUF6544 family protein, partial [Woeseiaceae bacterium]|nr:DUF6544 family protein [Woeseiaceae bacterium]